LILLSLLVLFFLYTFKQSKNKSHNEFEELEQSVNKSEITKTWLMLIISLAVLVFSAKLVVWGGSSLAKIAGISDLVIGLTVIALGTSLPELAVSISSVLKNQFEMVVGNVIGSNIFNTIAVLAIPGIIQPSNVPAEVFSRDYPIMLLLTAMLFFVSYNFKKNNIISRLEGFILVSVFCYYMWILF